MRRRTTTFAGRFGRKARGLASLAGIAALTLSFAAAPASADEPRPCAPTPFAQTPCSPPLCSPPPCASRRCDGPHFPGRLACPRGNPAWTVSGTETWNLPADLEVDRGELAIRRESLSIDACYDVRPGLAYTLGIGFERSAYDFSRPDAIVPGEGRLFEEAYEARIEPGFSWERGDWKVDSTAGLRVGFAPGADLSESLTGSLYLSVRRRIAGKVRLTIGALVETALEDDPFVVPVVLVDTPSSGPIRVEFRGKGVRAAYDLRPDLTIAALARYDRRDFRMAEDDRVGKGVFRELHVPIGLEVEWRPRPCVSLALSGGANVWNYARFEDRRGDKVVDSDVDLAPWFALSLTVRF